MHSESYLFFPSQRSREGRWLCRWCRRIWQLGLLHSPSPPSQVQGKGSVGQRGPVALLALIQADTWGHVSCALQALRHQLACLSFPWSSIVRETLSRTPCCEPMLARHLLFPGFFIFCWSPPGEGILSAQESFTVSLCCSQSSCFYSSCSFWFSYMFPAS